MSPNMKITLLALAGVASAVPHYGHKSFHHHRPSGAMSGSAPYPGGNSTGLYPTGTAVVPAGDKTTTILQTEYSTETLVSTIYLTRSKSSPAAEAANVETGAAGACGPATVYVTASEKVTITVPAGGASSPTPEASSVVPEAPSAPAYETPPPAPKSSSVVKEEAPSSVYTPPASTPEAVKTPKYTPPAHTPAYTPPAVESSAPVASSVAPSVAPSSSAPAPSPSAPSSPGYSGGKRGLAYRWDGAADCKSFASKGKFGFAWNWESDSRGDIGGLNFVPTLRTLDNAGTWASSVEAAISGGSSVVFGLNEPDMPSQANLSPGAACDAWKKYMNPVKEAHPNVIVAGPSVSSSESPNQGLDWLSQFTTQCPDAKWDAANIHWYGPYSAGFDAFKAHVDKAISQTGKKVWVTEFGLTGATPEQSADFLKSAMAYLDGNDNCQGYSYFAVGNFDAAANLLGSGDAMSVTGEVYAS